MEIEKSMLLQKQIKDNSEYLQSEFLDMKNWEDQMKRKERELLNEDKEQPILPPIRSKNKKSVIKESKSSKNSKRIKSYDYALWDKFDADKACEELEEGEQSEYSSKEPMSKEQLEQDHNKASEHKQQGNVLVQQKEWNKAITSYSEAIKIFPYDAVFYANRALCYLKQANPYSAEADCSSAIQLDDTYVKAYHRRATARMELNQYKEAKQDIETILRLEPSNKEASMFLSQVNKQLENSQPAIADENKRTKDISIEKQIIEKIVDKVKSNKEVIESKKNENKVDDKDIESIAKSETISVTKLKRNPCIPDWLPEKDNVEIVKPIKKPPHLCSKEPLKRISVQEADLSKPLKEKNETLQIKNKQTKLSDVHSNITIKYKENVTRLEESSIEYCAKIPPIPKTAVQFHLDWRKYASTSNFRYKYLKQLSLGSLSKIFKDSMESNIFSEILATLKIEFMKREEPIFSYLKDLSDVKRFRAFIMFIDNSEKQDLRLMFSYCKVFESISEKELIELQNKYEI